jgi:hypothetical protein
MSEGPEAITRDDLLPCFWTSWSRSAGVHQKLKRFRVPGAGFGSRSGFGSRFAVPLNRARRNRTWPLGTEPGTLAPSGPAYAISGDIRASAVSFPGQTRDHGRSSG